MSVNLTDVRIWMTQYLMSIFLGLGVLGNLINIYVFTRKNFIRNSCCMYLLAASTANLINVIWGIGPSLYTLTNVDPSTYSFMYCKLRLYTIHTTLMIGRAFIVFACVDRYALCSESVRLRSLREPKITIRVIIATILVLPLLTIHIAILENFNGTSCFMSGAYVLIYGLYSTMAAGILPPLLMTIFSVLTIRHRHRLRTRLNSTGRNSKRDHTLMIMLLSEVAVYIVTTILYPTITLYRAITNGQTMSAESTQILSFVSFLGGSFLIYLNSASVFYVYFIASKHFRKECKVAIKNLIRRMMGRRGQVEPRFTQANDTLNRETHF
jgi:hypothetical protein